MGPRVRPAATYRLTREVGLSHAPPALRVNALKYWEIDARGNGQHWGWTPTLRLRRDNTEALMRAGRARWKIENKTFNRLKNQGYHFEHHVGHSQQYLSSTEVDPKIWTVR